MKASEKVPEGLLSLVRPGMTADDLMAAWEKCEEKGRKERLMRRHHLMKKVYIGGAILTANFLLYFVVSIAHGVSKSFLLWMPRWTVFQVSFLILGYCLYKVIYPSKWCGHAASDYCNCTIR